MRIFLVLFLSATVVRGWSQGSVLSPEEMRKLVPARVEGFREEDNIKGKLIQIGNLRYSLCEHRFSKGKQMIRVLLFDYKDAPIMYSQATRDWKNFFPVTSDTTILRPFGMEFCKGWESFNKRNNFSQIYAGICDRYFLNLTGEGVELETLKGVFNQFHFEQFPK